MSIDWPFFAADPAGYAALLELVPRPLPEEAAVNHLRWLANEAIRYQRSGGRAGRPFPGERALSEELGWSRRQVRNLLDTSWAHPRFPVPPGILVADRARTSGPPIQSRTTTGPVADQSRTSRQRSNANNIEVPDQKRSSRGPQPDQSRTSRASRVETRAPLEKSDNAVTKTTKSPPNPPPGGSDLDLLSFVRRQLADLEAAAARDARQRRAEQQRAHDEHDADVAAVIASLDPGEQRDQAVAAMGARPPPPSMTVDQAVAFGAGDYWARVGERDPALLGAVVAACKAAGHGGRRTTIADCMLAVYLEAPR